MGKLRTIRDRAFAWMGVIVVLLSAGALTVFVLIQNAQDSSNSTNAPSTANASTCQIDGSAPADPLPAPDVYKPSGTVSKLQTTDLTTGKGAAVKSGDCLVMKYYGTLATTGAVFDEDFSKPTGLKFQIGQGQVIPGWDQGILGMKAGGVRRLVIPAALAYGNQSPSPSIPANSALVFVVKLISINQQ